MPKFKFFKKKDGFVAIETIFSLVPVVIFILILIGMFAIMYPRIMLQYEVGSLTQTAKVQGGLTNDDTQRFLDRMDRIGYDSGDVSITAFTEPSGYNLVGVTPIGEDGDNYLRRDSDELIVVQIEIPRKRGITAPLSAIGSSNADVLETHVVTESVRSERW